MTEQEHPLTGSQSTKIFLAWIVVLIPLGYGLTQTITSAVNLFTG